MKKSIFLKAKKLYFHFLGESSYTTPINEYLHPYSITLLKQILQSNKQLQNSGICGFIVNKERFFDYKDTSVLKKFFNKKATIKEAIEIMLSEINNWLSVEELDSL